MLLNADCDFINDDTEFPYGGYVGLVGQNEGMLESFVSNALNQSGTWNGIISMFLSLENESYMDYGVIDLNEVDEGGPWRVTNYALAYYEVFVDSM